MNELIFGLTMVGIILTSIALFNVFIINKKKLNYSYAKEKRKIK